MLDSRQIAEWMAYFSIEPFGEHAAYWRTGQIVAMIANVNRGKRTRAYKPEDFMPPEPKVDRGVQSPEEMGAVLQRAIRYAERRKKTKKRKL